MLNKKILFITVLALVPYLALAQEDSAEGGDNEEATYALVEAVRDGDVRAVRKLLGEGADANAATDAGLPILGYAAMKGETAIAEALIEAGADLNAKDLPGATPLMYAAQFGHNDIVKALIEAGADVNAADNLGWTPLIRAVIGGNVEAVNALLEAGADKTAKDFFGRDALKVAEGRDEDDIVAVLSGTANG